jgi:hypothetical protein
LTHGSNAWSFEAGANSSSPSQFFHVILEAWCHIVKMVSLIKVTVLPICPFVLCTNL